MIEEPPLLTLKEADRRPTEEQVATIGKYPTGFIADAMDGVGGLPTEIALLAPDDLPDRLCGVALTCQNSPGDILSTLAALAQVQAGDVVIAATGGWRGCAAAGDRILGMAKNAGAVGFVTDGLMRDRAGIINVGLPAYCTGLSPNSPYSNGPGSVGLPVTIGTVSIATGDLVVGDRDGVVIIPFDRIASVAERVERVATLEAELDAEVAEGFRLPGQIADLLKSDRVRRV